MKEESKKLVLQLTKEYRVERLDKHCLKLERRIYEKYDKKKDDIVPCDEYVFAGYFGDVFTATECILKKHPFEEGQKELKDYLKKIEDMHNELKANVKNV